MYSTCTPLFCEHPVGVHIPTFHIAALAITNTALLATYRPHRQAANAETQPRSYARCWVVRRVKCERGNLGMFAALSLAEGAWRGGGGEQGLFRSNSCV